jgi:isopentenyl phosphate kinase
MNLEHEVRTVMRQSANALTVDQVTQEVAERIKSEIRSVLNTLVKNKELQSVHGGGSYSTHYKAPPIERRV